MKYLCYVIKTKKYYLTCLVFSIFLLIISVMFSRYWKRTTETIKTFESCSSNVIAYDAMPDTKDSFENYERKVRTSLIEEEGESLNVYVYQFIENANYTDKTIVNINNVLYGDFKILETNEIAIPNSVAENYDLHIGNKIFVGGNQCEIKYIYRDVYQIYEVDYSSTQTVVLVGFNTIADTNAVNYCNFDPGDSVHQQLKDLNTIRSGLYKQRMVFLIGISFLTFLCYIVISLFRKKEEVKTFRNYRFSGGKNLYIKLLLVEIIFIIPSLLLVSCIDFAISIQMSLILLIAVATMFGWLSNLFFVYIKILR